MSLIKKLQKRYLKGFQEPSKVMETKTTSGKFSDMVDGGVPAEIVDRSVVDILHFENEGNLTKEEWENLGHKVIIGNPEGEYITSSKTEINI